MDGDVNTPHVPEYDPLTIDTDYEQAMHAIDVAVFQQCVKLAVDEWIESHVRYLHKLAHRTAERVRRVRECASDVADDIFSELCIQAYTIANHYDNVKYDVDFGAYLHRSLQLYSRSYCDPRKKTEESRALTLQGLNHEQVVAVGDFVYEGGRNDLLSWEHLIPAASQQENSSFLRASVVFSYCDRVLNEYERALIRLVFVMGMQKSQIDTYLSKSQGSTKYHINNALRKLRVAMEADERKDDSTT